MTAEKIDRGLVDFSDLEHYALANFIEHEEDGNLCHLILQWNIRNGLKKY